MNALTHHDIAACEHVDKILKQFNAITALPKLQINDETMHLFHQFLNLLSNQVSAAQAEQVLAHPAIQAKKLQMQSLFSQASSLYERYWAERIIQSPSPEAYLTQQYPYYQHYQRATGLEINAIQALTPNTSKKVLMVGSGALPLTSIALAKHHYEITNLDINEADLLLGKAVCNALTPNEKMVFIHNDICLEQDLADYDVVWLAALVGDQTIKHKIIQHLYQHVKPGSLMVIRTAFNLRTLLYPSICEQALSPFQLKLKIQTYADNFHSILIAQKPL